MAFDVTPFRDLATEMMTGLLRVVMVAIPAVLPFAAVLLVLPVIIAVAAALIRWWRGG